MPPIGVRPEFKTNGKAPQGEAFANDIFDVFQLGGLPGCVFLRILAGLSTAPKRDVVYPETGYTQYQNGIELGYRCDR